MKARYVTMTAALVLSILFGAIYIWFFSTINSTITIYVCQGGIYQEEANANEMKQNLENLELPTYTYQKDGTYIVISDIFLNEEEALALGQTISENQITSAIIKYKMPKGMQSLIEDNNYEEILKELEKH